MPPTSRTFDPYLGRRPTLDPEQVGPMLDRAMRLTRQLRTELPVVLANARTGTDVGAGFPRSSRASIGRGAGGHGDPTFDAAHAASLRSGTDRARYRDAVRHVGAAVDSLLDAVAAMHAPRRRDDVATRRARPPVAQLAAIAVDQQRAA